MWEIWLIVSGIFFGAAGYLALKRSRFRYAPKEVIYSSKEEIKKPGRTPLDTPPIDAEYTMSKGSAAQEPVPPPFFAEMGGAVQDAKSEPAERITSPAHADNPSSNEEKNHEKEKFRNLRFFDS